MDFLSGIVSYYDRVKMMLDYTSTQSDKQELAKLKNQIQQLQKELQSRQMGNKSSTNLQQPNNGFN